MAIRVMNVQQGYTDKSGVFHPIRASVDYNGMRVGAEKPKLVKAKRKAAAKKAATTKMSKRKAVLAGKAPKRTSNPIPMDKFVNAKVRMLKGGLTQILLTGKAVTGKLVKGIKAIN